MTSRDLDYRLRAALSRPMSSEQRAALDERLMTRVEASPRRRPRVRRNRVTLALVMALAVAPTVFAASAAIRLTESPNGLSSAAEFQAEIDAAKGSVPLPPGATWPPSLNVSDRSGSYSRGGGRTQVEFVAFCAWDRAWLDAEARGDAGASERARSQIEGVRGWQVYRGEFATDSSRSMFDRVIAGVQSGDRSGVGEFVALNCGE